MKVRVLAFAALRELFRTPSLTLDLPEGAVAEDVWNRLACDHPSLGEHRAAARLTRNGAIVTGSEPLAEGDEVALLPPFGGG